MKCVLAAFFVLVAALTAGGAPSARGEAITVAAAVSLKEALSDVAVRYKAETGEGVEFTFGSSGQLANQVLNGAPVDLFVSAANRQVDDLDKAGAIVDSSRRVVAGNSLVLVVPAGSDKAPTSLGALTTPAVTRVAVGEPGSVPAGQYAREALERAGVWAAVRDKLVLGTNVRQVLDYVERGEVSAGIVYATDAKQAGAKVRVACVIDPRDHGPIVYPAAIVKASAKRAAARLFLDYLTSEAGQSCLKKHGFSPPPVESSAPPPQ